MTCWPLTPPGAGWHGVISCVGCAKIGVFYISFLPQFVPAHVRVGPYLFVLSGVQAGVSLLWLVVVACMGHSLARLLRQGATARLMDRLTGCVFIGFGLRLGLSRH